MLSRLPPGELGSHGLPSARRRITFVSYPAINVRGPRPVDRTPACCKARRWCEADVRPARRGSFG
nr:MAG TPA: hypothetical protein [Caudoviricetes sp.]